MYDLVIAFAFTTLLSIQGLRRQSLSPSGAATSVVVGVLLISGGLRVFGVALVVFYALGHRATRYGKDRKVRLEEGYVADGNRTGWQVLCNSVWAVAAASLWNAIHVPGSIHATLLRLSGITDLSGRVYTRGSWCPATSDTRYLLFAVLGHFGCCLGDTLASELGILAKSKPRLVTTMRTVPPGTNGGMTVWGTFCSVVGGVVIGLVMGVTLVLESRGACGSGAVIGEMVVWGAFAGGVGSLVDSVLGATVQQTRYNKERGIVLLDGSATAGKVVSGLNVLTNNQVNLLSSLATAGVVAAMTS